MSTAAKYRTASGRVSYARMAHDAQRELLFTRARLQDAERELRQVPKPVRVVCRIVCRLLRGMGE